MSISSDTADLLRRPSFREMIDALPMPIYTTDAEGKITHFNPAAVEFSGRTPDVGTDQWCVSWKLFHADGTPMPHDECPMSVTLRERRPIRGVEAIAERPDGSRVWFEPYPTPLFDEDGRLVGGINLLLDITSRKSGEIAKARLAAIVESSDDAIVSKDLNSIITSWNAGAERIFGYSAREAIGRPITMLIPEDRSDEEPEILLRIRGGKRVDHYETVRRRKDGSLIDVSLSVSPLLDSTGRVVGASKIARDITPRKRAEEDLREADRRKDEFLAILSHELRNPLAPLLNAMSILQVAGREAESWTQTREMMERQLSHMVRLIDDLLDVSRISQDKLELKQERVNLTQLLRHAVETNRPQCERHGLELTLTLPARPLYVKGDMGRLAQAVNNLLNNSCKYTERSGRIRLTLEREGGEAVIRVQDTGVGIAADQLPRIFEMFVQVDGSIDRSQGGLGIGLTLSKRLVEMHGGRLTASSPGLGLGAEFAIHLPIVEPAPQAQGNGGDPAAAPVVPRCILVVDDNQDAADSLALLLKISGHKVHTAKDGVEAVERAGTIDPDVILLDIGLPKMNGYEAAREIRKQPREKRLLLVALTGWGQEKDKQLSKEAGFDAHVIKPVSLAALTKVLGDGC